MASNMRQFSCFSLLISTTIVLLVVTRSASSKGVTRDTSLATKSMVGNRTVTCSGDTTGRVYPWPMYTCHHIRVDGRKLLHGFDDQYDQYEHPVPQCNDCPCGRIRWYNNDNLQICRELMINSGYNSTVSAAYVLNPRCEQKGPEPRSLYTKVNPNTDIYTWLDHDIETGYLTTLQCLGSK